MNQCAIRPVLVVVDIKMSLSPSVDTGEIFNETNAGNYDVDSIVYDVILSQPVSHMPVV